MLFIVEKCRYKTEDCVLSFEKDHEKIMFSKITRELDHSETIFSKFNVYEPMYNTG